jgi:two-component system response regulator YesN
MIRLIIVDDEERIRLGLAKMIENKQDSELQVAGSFANGKEALEAISHTEVDILMTDIKMPQMNGLELIETVYKQNPNLKCVILSGFSDFQYARTAMRFGVLDYLLKPIDKGELYAAIDKLKLTVQKTRQEEQEQRQMVFTQLLTQPLSEAQVQVMFTELTNKEKDTQTYRLITAKIKPFIPGNLLNSILTDLNKHIVVYSPLGLNQLVMVVKGLNNPIAYKEWTGELLKRLSKYGAVSMGASPPFQGWQELIVSCERSVKAAYYGVYSQETHRFYQYEDIEVNAVSKKAIYDLIEKKLSQELQVLDVDKIKETLKSVFAAIKLSRPDLSDIADICNTMVYVSKKEVSEFAPISQQAWGDDGNWLELFQNCIQWSEIEQIIESKMTQVLEQVKSTRMKQGNWVIEKVKEMIEASFQDDMELTRLAEAVFLTPSYLSKLFKAETGVTITEYLIDIRIQKAKDLLKGQMELKTYEVGERIGYSDPAYFNKIFKKTTGLTPKEFRDKCRH